MKYAPKCPFLRVGVTGGIGSGKSTVCRLFSSIGRHVVSADDVAHRIANDNPETKIAILKEFGPSAYLANGLLDRKKIASVVFADRKKRKKLDSIIHPRVFKAIDSQLESIPPEQAYPYVLVEAALIFETGMERSLDHVIVVAADEHLCVQRVVARDRVSPDEVRRRIAAQMPMTKKTRQGGFVIQNNGDESELRPAVMFLHNLFTGIMATRQT